VSIVHDYFCQMLLNGGSLVHLLSLRMARYDIRSLLPGIGNTATVIARAHKVRRPTRGCPRVQPHNRGLRPVVCVADRVAIKDCTGLGCAEHLSSARVPAEHGFEIAWWR
jgi:hypothetical protein